VACRYLCSQANRYPYGGLAYRTADAYFVVRLAGALAAGDDVLGFTWEDPAALDPAGFAFASARAALACYRQGGG